MHSTWPLQVSGVKYLKDDPVIVCWEGMHRYFCALAALGLLGMCVCVPLLILRVTTRYHFAGTRVEQEHTRCMRAACALHACVLHACALHAHCSRSSCLLV